MVQLVVPDGAVSTGMPVTMAPGIDDGVTSFQVPPGPEAVDSTTGPEGVAPTAAQVALATDAGLPHATPR